MAIDYMSEIIPWAFILINFFQGQIILLHKDLMVLREV